MTTPTVNHPETVLICEADFDSLCDSGFIITCEGKDDDGTECTSDVILNDMRDYAHCRDHGGSVDEVGITEDPEECSRRILCRSEE